MEEGGERKPLISPDENEDEDEDEENTTQPFQPGDHSTPGPSGEEIPMTTFNRSRERGLESTETYFIEWPIPRRNLDSSKIELANLTLEKNYPEFGKHG